MKKIHEVFPLIVYQGSLECHEKFKEDKLEEVKEYWFNGYEYESPEASSRIFLHLNENYSELFKNLRTIFDEYFDALNIDYQKLNYHVVKSWVVYHRDDSTPALRPHKHNEANISFVYYLKTDETSDKFVVSQQPDTNVNQVCQGFFDTADVHNIMTGYNRYNCNHYTITPTEGSVIVMPSNTYHHTVKKVRERERVAIAGDVRVTLKPEHYKHHQGCTHPSQWREL
tara:strand:+ start:610 stop:1290 length:681 start_codon:yes stop_codon:yes gene_type:complete